MICAETVLECVNYRDHPIEGAKELIRGKFLQKVGVFEPETNHSITTVKAVCFRASNPQEVVEITVRMSKEDSDVGDLHSRFY